MIKTIIIFSAFLILSFFIMKQLGYSFVKQTRFRSIGIFKFLSHEQAVQKLKNGEIRKIEAGAPTIELFLKNGNIEYTEASLKQMLDECGDQCKDVEISVEQ